MQDSADKMSEDAEDNQSSTGFSDDGSASLVGFGEAASSSNRSGPTSVTGKSGGISGVPKQQQRHHHERSGSPMEGVVINAGTSHGQEQAEKIIGETMRDPKGKPLGSPVKGKDLGRFSFESK